jgi:hypothetical protein
MEQCDYHTQLVADIAVIKNDIVYIKDKVCKHVEEGEEKGGFRDRLVVVELAVSSLTKEISALKTAKWMTAVIGGLIGGLVAQALPETIEFVVKLFFRQ